MQWRARLTHTRSSRPVLVVSALALASTLGCSGMAPSDEMYAWMNTPPSPDAGPPKPSAPDSPFKDWSEVTKDAEEMEGVFTLYKNRDALHAEITNDQLDKDFLVALSIGQGVGSNFLLGGLPWGTKLVQFRRAGDSIHLVEVNTRFLGGSDEAIQNAVNLSYGESVLHAFAIESEKDSTSVLVDLGSFLKTDYPNLGTFLGFVMNTGVRLDKDRSHVSSVKAFPSNAEFDVAYTYAPSGRFQGLPAVSDSRGIPVTIHYSISELPETDYVPRLADPRVGYFLTAHKNFSAPSESGYYTRYINRWHLEKADPSADVSDPVEPIVYHIDPTIPEAYRPWVREGIEAWQDAYEAAGISNAIIARDVTDDIEDYDPEDVRFNSIRWITSHRQAFGAIGPSRVNPRTGQILDADILIEDSFVQGIKNLYTRMVNTSGVIQRLSSGMSFHDAMMDPELKAILDSGLLPGGSEHRMCLMGTGFAQNAALAGLAMIANGQIGAGDEVPEEFVGEGMKWVVMHEVGHTLGLRHNFKSSSDIPFERLNDRNYIEKNGMTASVMDYAAPNVALDAEKQGYYYGPNVGRYDRWAIRYGYTNSGAESPAEEEALLRAIASESTRPGHSYATDEDTYAPTAPDPRNAIFDLSGDPLAWAERQCAIVDRLMKSPNFENILLTDGDNYPKLRRAFSTVLFNRFNAVFNAAKYVGGTYVSRDHFGDENGDPPLSPISAAEQRRALRLVSDNLFAEDAFDVPSETLSHLMPERWSHWGVSSFNVDFLFPLHDFAQGVGASALGVMHSAPTLRRMKEAENIWGDTLTMAEMFDTITGDIWSELDRGRNVSSMRRDLQRVHLGYLVRMAVTPYPGLPDDASALARHHLTKLESKTASAARSSGDTYTRAHYEWVADRIDKALKAELEVGI